jgi:hypothetical protein
MTTFITFTETRKQQIDHLRARLMTERPYTHVYWGDSVRRMHPLGLAEYVVYAALRGADYRKGDHTGGSEATIALKSVIHQLNGWLGDKHVGKSTLIKWLPEGHGDAELKEMVEALSAELAKWKDAPDLVHPQHVPAKPIGNFFDALKGEAK